MMTRPSCGTLTGAGRVGRKAEPVLADAHARMQHDARSDHAVAKRDIGADPAIVADLDPGADHGIGADLAAPAEPHAALDHGIRSDLAILGHGRRRIDQRGRRPAGDRPARGIEGLRRERKGLVGLAG